MSGLGSFPPGAPDRLAYQGEQRPKMICPHCDHIEDDYDGFGMLACDECGWCSHPDRYGGECKICGDRGTRDEH